MLHNLFISMLLFIRSHQNKLTNSEALSSLIIGVFLPLEDFCRPINCSMRPKHLVLTIHSLFSLIYIALPSDFDNFLETSPLSAKKTARKASEKANESSAAF